MALPAKQAKSWSISRYHLYQQCPYRFKLQNLDKYPVKETVSPALEHGRQAHDAIDAYLKGTTRTVPKEGKVFAPLLKDIKSRLAKTPHLAEVESTWALRADWTETRFDDWNGCWVRIKTDSAFLQKDKATGAPIANIDDWKTGKFRPDNQSDYLEQLELYALGGLIKWQNLIPMGLTVVPRLRYLDYEGPITHPPAGDEKVYTGDDLEPLKKLWAKRVKPMMNDKKFAPKPNKFCGWCPYGVSKGGPCKFG